MCSVIQTVYLDLAEDITINKNFVPCVMKVKVVQIFDGVVWVTLCNT